ncbi:ArnT family glycosyltransferase [Streptomyces sp. NPDC003247]|uniref:ArnT family glycosyltransferase n=1 Tax=Streptomyces sp. NPDC003247 TaxID=3364677 RepID=UPI0036885137
MTEPTRTLSAAPAPHSTPPAAVRTLPSWAAPAALAAILVLAAVLYGWALGSLGWGNAYYAAAVKSMGQSWTNFLFGAYDPAGVVTVDKPPAALWPQVISSKVFGLHGWALILPQLVEGVAAVFVLHRTVRRWAGEGAGLLAALVLTLTPITVAINRDNNPDTLLVLLLVSAAYTLTRALRARGRSATWWLCACAFLTGCGFLTKMLAAWMIVPAFALAWLVGAADRPARRVLRLPAAGAVLAVSSLWWIALVAVWPGDRPYIGGSTDGSAWDLVIGYNGLGRVFGSSGDSTQSIGGAGGGFGGAAGVGRLFNDQVGGQISWLLPACLVAVVVAVVCAVLRRRGRLATDAVLPASGWLLWGTWLVVCAAVFSTQKGIFHPYYTSLLAPAIAALAGGLLAALVRVHRAGLKWAPATGAVAALSTAVWAAVLIRRTPDWNGWLVWAVPAAACATLVLLLLARRRGRLIAAGAAVAVVTVLLAPAVWAASVPATSGSAGAMGGSNPTAGPATTPGFGGGGGMPGPGSAGTGPTSGDGTGPSGMPSGMPELPEGQAPSGMPELPEGQAPSGMPELPEGQAPSGVPDLPEGQGAGQTGQTSGGAPTDTRDFGGAHLTADQRKILDYAVEHAPDARIKLAVSGGANAANAFILGSDETVIGMGGFSGTDDAPSTAQLEQWTENGELRYVLGQDDSSAGTLPGLPGTSQAASGERADWISGNCTKVPASAYGGSETSAQDNGAGPLGGGTVLYDCAPG